MSAANSQPDPSATEGEGTIQDLPLLEETEGRVVGGSGTLLEPVDPLAVQMAAFETLSNASKDRHNAAMEAIQNMKG